MTGGDTGTTAVVAFLRACASQWTGAQVGAVELDDAALDLGLGLGVDALADDARVRIVETNMSWVLLAGERVLKLKKAVRRPFLDFSTLALRELYCREEVRLNGRLAPGVYLGVMAVQRTSRGWALVPERSLPGPGTTVDWVVLMRRLPAARMLDRLIAAGGVPLSEIDALARVLAAFYRDAPRVRIAPADYVGRLESEQSLNRLMLCSAPFALDDAPRACEAFERALARLRPALAARADDRLIVDGHGDLRLEHVCLLERPLVIDCLEFSASLRQVDPYDELAFLALELELAHAPRAAERLLQTFTSELGDAPPAAVVALYGTYRALVRARLAIAHLLDPAPRSPERWRPLAQRYLARALAGLSRVEGG